MQHLTQLIIIHTSPRDATAVALSVAVALLAGQWTCDSQVVGSSPGWAPLHRGLGQANLFGWESNRRPGGK